MSNCTVPSNAPDILGPYVFGYQFNWALYGVLVVQVYFYYVSPIVDQWPIQAVVYGTVLIETVQVAFATHDSFFQLAVSWGHVDQLMVAHWTWLTLPVLIGIISMITQLFYAWRIHVLSRGWVMSGVISLLALLQGASALATGVRAYLLDKSLKNVSTNLLTTDIVWLTSTAVCDLLIFSCMIYYLSKMRTGINSTERIINRLIRLFIETGLLTTIAATLDLGLFIGLPSSPWFVILSLALSKLYSNSLLAVLNHRSSLRYRRSKRSNSDDIPSSDPSMGMGMGMSMGMSMSELEEGAADDSAQCARCQRNRRLGLGTFRAYVPPSVGMDTRLDSTDGTAGVMMDEGMERAPVKRSSGDERTLNLIHLQFANTDKDLEEVERHSKV
ncbi:hypothetical protein CONPUDRAFT_166480 [Coniophora puteana RWD-64-598 SS2]|uniref:DUF6534 domain-containing protein n=1 Tax=Coniophora puteana (strain RWD-64-598) TaxID=741705 RepID=A0A5M3MM67_CONPW|nr:uncharacterized protein CONPUDRAFT_166480 [Coniophora puteana RWD-64-598 SS2]EIW79775.1 hypothetical protein CONPUDRAFT_166480 [Coniophora puteana RWD-64-598 SS2]